jgi:phage-related minor tail protein
VARSSNKIHGITIELNGDASGLQKELKAVNSDLKSTQDQIRDVNKMLKFNPGNADLLSQKQRLLNQELTETKNKLEIEKKALAEISAQNTTGEQQAQQDALQREVIETENKVKSLEKQMKSFGSVGAQQVAALGEKLKEVGAKITDVGKEMTAKLTVPITAAFGVATAAASDYEENLNKIDVAFGASAQSVKDWANNAIEQFGLSKLAATNATSSFGALAKGIGVSESSAAEMSVTLAGLSADLASYFNTGTDESAKALEGIFTGEAESLKKYGVIMNETNVKAFAEQHGMLYDQLSQVEKAMVRYQYVLDKTGDAQGDYARTADGTSNSMKTFKAALEDLGVAFGEEILPVITPIIRGLTNLIRAIGSLPAPVRKAIVIIGMVVAAIGPLLIAIGSIVSGIGGLMTLIPGIVGALGAGGLATAATGAAGGIAAAGGALAGLLPTVGIAVGVIAGLGIALYEVAKHWPEISQAAKDAANAVKQKMADMANAVKQSKVGQEASKVAAEMKKAFESAGGGLKGVMSAAFAGVKKIASDTGTAIWRKYGEDFQRIGQTVSNAMTNVRNSISNGINSARTTVASAATAMRSSITTEFTSIKNSANATFGTSYDSIKSKATSAFDDIKKSASDAKTSIESGWNSLKSTANSVFGYGYDSVKTKVSDAFDAIKTSAANTKKDIETGWSSLKTTATNVFSSGYDSIKTKVQSVFDTISDNAGGAKTTFSNMFSDMKTTASNDLSNITTSVSNAYNKAKNTLSTALKMAFTSDFKTPSIMVSGRFDVDRYGNITTKPTLSLKWNKKAMQFGAILDGATIFGAQGNTLLGGGEAGKEAIIGVHSLYDLVHNASANGNNMLAQRVDTLTSLLMQYLPDIAAEKGVYLNDNALVGQLMPTINRSLGLQLT